MMQKLILLAVKSLCLVRAWGDLCQMGIVSPLPHPDGSRSCCSKACGQIGCSADDHRCGRNPGGPSKCCQRYIYFSKNECKKNDDTGCLLPSTSGLEVAVAPLPARAPVAVGNNEGPQEVPGEIPVFWINMQTSSDRAAFLREQFSGQNFKSAYRVNAVTTEEVRLQIQKHLMATTDNKTMWWPTTSDNWTPYFSVPSEVGQSRQDLYESDPRLVSCGEGCLSLGELACILSHITAIKMAFEAGLEAAMIMEDDARIVGDFYGPELEGYLKAAGPNSIIQLYMTGPKDRVLEALTHERGSIFSGYGHSTIGYLLTRDCMASIIKYVGNGGKNIGYFLWALRWVHHPRVSQWPADYSLYDSCTSYTSARPFMRHQTSFGSTIHMGHEEYHQKTEDLLDQALSNLPENNDPKRI